MIIKPGNFVQINVTDTGIGMDPEVQARIFDPFFTTKSLGRGTGLGLASAYGIIKNHNGFIKVVSEKGNGATFMIHLPASQKTVDQTKKLEKPTFLTGTETVLLVDDEEMILDVGKAMLQKIGYVVLTAKGGQAGIDVLKEHRDKIDVVILDMIMPGMSGEAAFQGLKAVKPNVVILLSSGYSIDGQASRIISQGCAGFIQKPFSIQRLSLKLREVIDKK